MAFIYNFVKIRLPGFDLKYVYGQTDATIFISVVLFLHIGQRTYNKER
jgi:hypothetical protein